MEFKFEPGGRALWSESEPRPFGIVCFLGPLTGGCRPLWVGCRSGDCRSLWTGSKAPGSWGPVVARLSEDGGPLQEALVWADRVWSDEALARCWGTEMDRLTCIVLMVVRHIVAGHFSPPSTTSAAPRNGDYRSVYDRCTRRPVRHQDDVTPDNENVAKVQLHYCVTSLDTATFCTAQLTPC